MKTRQLSISGSAIVDTEPFEDHRGVFARWFCSRELDSLIGSRPIVNMNYSKTKLAGSIRGMHFQFPPKSEMKLVRCIRGKVFDVMVDLRKGSPTFLQWHGEILTAENMKMLVIPEGLAHGFQALENNSEMLYLHTEFYSKECDAGIHYNDPIVGIQWPMAATEISEKDNRHPFLDTTFKGISI